MTRPPLRALNAWIPNAVMPRWRRTSNRCRPSAGPRSVGPGSSWSTRVMAKFFSAVADIGPPSPERLKNLSVDILDAELPYRIGTCAWIPFDHSVRLAVVGQEVEERLCREGLGPEDTGARPDALGEQLERNHRVQSRLEDDGLVAVLTHGLLVVGDVVQVGGPRLAVLAGAGDEGARARLPPHPVAEGRGIRQRGGDDVAR